MSTIHVKYGLEFRPDLYQSRDRGDWLQAVGEELEKKGVTLALGEGAGAFTIQNGAELSEFYEQYKSDPQGVADKVGLAPGRDLQRYVSDLVQALDDIVKDTSGLQSGQSIDLRASGELGKMLGLDDASVRYASSRSGFGTTPAEGSMSVMGVMLSRNAAELDPLDGVPHMNPTTFDATSLKTGRRSQEYEAVRILSGLSKDELIGMLRSERGGRSLLHRMRKAKDAEAFSLGYQGVDLDEMRWDSRAHSIREANPFISLTVESGRMEMDDKDGVHEVGLGNDYFEDAYYDTADFSLNENDMSVRARVRRDDPEPGAGAVRRVLIQSKIGSNVDEDGVKFAAKADIRKDSPTEEDIANLDEDLRSGISEWGTWGNSGGKPIEAMGLVYEKLDEAGALATVGDQEGILQLEKQAHVRSTRSRFHFNLTSKDSMQKLFTQLGDPNIEAALALAKESTGMEPDVAAKLTALGEGILDRSVFVDQLKDKLAALDPNLAPQDVTADTINALWPGRSLSGNKVKTLQQEVLAEAISETFHEFGELLDDQRSRIAGSRGNALDDFEMTEEVITFMKGKFPNMLSKQTVKPFLDKLDAELSGPNKDAFLQELSTFMADEEGSDVLASAGNLDEAIGNVRKHMVSDHLEIVHRQIESAGSMSKALWFDNARSNFAGVSGSSWSNFLIDTFDVSEFYTPQAWDSLSPEEKAGGVDVSADKMFHATLVNEVQIELGYEKPYTDAVTKAEAQISDAKAGLLMDFALDKGLGGVVANQPASFEAFRQELLGMPESEQQQLLDQLNAFSQDKGSPLTFDKAAIEGFVEAQFSTRMQGKDTSGHEMLLKDVEVNTFIWGKLLDMQESIADLRGRRVKREAERAGFDDTEWSSAALSKGDTAISMIKDGIQ